MRGNTVVVLPACTLRVVFTDGPCTGTLAFLKPDGPALGETFDEFRVTEAAEVNLDDLAPGAVWARFLPGQAAHTESEWNGKLEAGSTSIWPIACSAARTALVKVRVHGASLSDRPDKLFIAPLSGTDALQAQLKPTAYSITDTRLDAQWTDCPVGSAVLSVGATCHRIEIPESEVVEIEVTIEAPHSHQFLFVDAVAGIEVTPG